MHVLTEQELHNLAMNIVGKQLEEEGFEHNIESDFIIEDLKSRNKVSDDDIDKLLKGFTKIYKNIESIYRDRDYYFSFRPDDQNRYFWLRIDQVFYTGE